MFASQLVCLFLQRVTSSIAKINRSYTYFFVKYAFQNIETINVWKEKFPKYSYRSLILFFVYDRDITSSDIATKTKTYQSLPSIYKTGPDAHIRIAYAECRSSHPSVSSPHQPVGAGQVDSPKWLSKTIDLHPCRLSGNNKCPRQ